MHKDLLSGASESCQERLTCQNVYCIHRLCLLVFDPWSGQSRVCWDLELVVTQMHHFYLWTLRSVMCCCVDSSTNTIQQDKDIQKSAASCFQWGDNRNSENKLLTSFHFILFIFSCFLCFCCHTTGHLGQIVGTRSHLWEVFFISVQCWGVLETAPIHVWRNPMCHHNDCYTEFV